MRQRWAPGIALDVAFVLTGRAWLKHIDCCTDCTSGCHVSSKSESTVAGKKPQRQLGYEKISQTNLPKKTCRTSLGVGKLGPENGCGIWWNSAKSRIEGACGLTRCPVLSLASKNKTAAAPFHHGLQGGVALKDQLLTLKHVETFQKLLEIC